MLCLWFDVIKLLLSDELRSEFVMRSGTQARLQIFWDAAKGQRTQSLRATEGAVSSIYFTEEVRKQNTPGSV